MEMENCLIIMWVAENYSGIQSNANSIELFAPNGAQYCFSTLSSARWSTVSCQKYKIKASAEPAKFVFKWCTLLSTQGHG